MITVDLTGIPEFIEATTRAARRIPSGRDLQHRLHDAEGLANPWISLAIRSTVACEHHNTVCVGCLDSWSDDHEIRIADVPTTVDLDAHRASADEFYIFDGDPELRLPPYWVARHGRTVTSQIEGEPVATVLLRDDEFARAEFADACCDTTPTGPGAIRAGDTIELYDDGTDGNTEVTVTTSTPTDDGYTITATTDAGQPTAVTVAVWRYRIRRRPR